MPAIEGSEAKESIFAGSQLALGGLLYGIGVLDAEEVLRYMDATFRQQALEKEGKHDE